MQLNLKLSQMGLILVGIPAAFEILFLIALFVLLNQAETEIRQESHSREVIAHAHNLAERITNAGIAIGAYGYSRSPMAKHTFEASINSMQRELLALTRLLKNDKQQMHRLMEVTATVEETLKQVEESRNIIEHTSSLSLLGGDTTMSDNLDKLSGLAGKLQKQIDDLVRAEQKLHRDLPARRSRSRQGLFLALIAGAVLNIAMAVLLAGFFSRVVGRRHQVLIDNTVRLARAQELHPPLSGSDEIALLDSVFHNMVHDLEQADRFKKQLIAMASHELRAPLTSIDAILTFLSAGGTGELPAGASRKLATAEVEVQRLIRLINELLDVERMEAGKFDMTPASVDLNDLIARSIYSVSGALERKELSMDIANTRATLWADEDRIIQVLVNLLSNAIKFSPVRGKISVLVEEREKEIQVSVKDEGRGIPASLQEKIFERFTQVDKSDASDLGGSGLGLTICRAIISQHGGTIGVESEEGKGATFWFRLPLKSPERTV